jgi:hemerythrin-like domain-containing protein
VFSVDQKRRQLLAGLSLAGTGVLIAACRKSPGGSSSATNDEPRREASSGGAEDAPGVDVAATEDLMREHGIIRRALLIYREAATKLKQDPASVKPDALEKTATLVRVFGEDYHEKQLEETFIFPALKKTQSPALVYLDVLMAQHARGRELTDYLLNVTKADQLPINSVNTVISAMESFARMYEHHMAVEDTIIFPAWKAAIGERELDELSAKFEEIEDEAFGGDGFDAASKRMSEIEQELGLANLGMFTAPPLTGS